NLRVSSRIVYRPGEPLARYFLFLAPSSQESALRRFIAFFSRLELINSGIQASCSLNDLYAMIGDFPRWRSRISAGACGEGDPWFLPDFLILPSLEQLIWNARSLGTALSYQCNFWPCVPDRDSMRGSARNLLRVEAFSGVPEAL